MGKTSGGTEHPEGQNIRRDRTSGGAEVRRGRTSGETKRPERQKFGRTKHPGKNIMYFCDIFKVHIEKFK
jgi:hypothetical protein